MLNNKMSEQDGWYKAGKQDAAKAFTQDAVLNAVEKGNRHGAVTKALWYWSGVVAQLYGVHLGGS